MYWVRRSYLSEKDRLAVCEYYARIEWQWRAVLTSAKNSSRYAILRNCAPSLIAWKQGIRHRSIA
jgi:hypothetical protein